MAHTNPYVTSHPGFQGWIGAASEDITPPAGIYFRNWGAATGDVAAGVHRPLLASVISLQSSVGDNPLVLVSLDLGWHRTCHDEQFVRHSLLQALNLGEERLMVHFTHTHAAPVLCREDRDRPGGTLIEPYLESLIDAIVRAVRRSLQSAVQANLEWDYGRCTLARNRDLEDPAGDRFLSGYNPAGAHDDALLVGRAVSLEGRSIATLINYACHPTTLAWENQLISPDFVGAMRDLVVENTDSSVCLYLQGASGELAPREQYTADTAIADRNGRQLGFAVLSTLSGMLPPGTRLAYSGTVESGAPLAVWRRQSTTNPATLEAVKIEVELPLQPMPTADELNAQIASSGDRVLIERLVRKRRIREGVGNGVTTLMLCWIWQVGDAVILGHPNEAYSMLQRELRQRFPDVAIAVMNVVNGHYGYLPPEGLYGVDMYPVWQSPFGRGSLERLIEACGTTIGELAGHADSASR